ncbi:flagellin [Endozoicomonas sp. SM1973]|uniref:Flagellin n=1 Tax=Spartinivicinus marinus TaxID=2994442 RepID=A0A853I0H0_9GAMM|nr:flagellin [Spartinivicinus marinus]MCX4029885.1 flagellin [Spartinivicinus marinus]NYZ64872.1 flagellin [Spartinivicinus marinus]
MPQIINTNIASIMARRNLDTSQAAQDQALQRLSSGLRINSARDDAAGLAISSRLDAQIRGTSVAIRNANDGISLAQTAEGALGSISSNLQRIRDLALQSANGSNTSIDREALNAEVKQLVTEIQNVAEKTNFNGKKLLDGTFAGSIFQTGANLGDTIGVSITKATTDSLGSAIEAGISSNRIAAAALTAGDLVINGVAVGASSGVDDSFSTGSQAQSAIAKAAAVNKVSEQTGVVAKVDGTSVAGNTYATSTDNQGKGISINGVSISVSTDAALSTEANLLNVAAAINEKSGQTGVVASFDGNATTGITLTASDGRNIVLADGTVNTSAIGLGAAGTFIGTYSLISQDGKDITLDTTTGAIDNAGFEVGSYSGVNSGVAGDNVTNAALATGDLVINGVAVGPTQASFDTSSIVDSSFSAIAKAAAINLVSGQTGVTAKANTTFVISGAITAGTAQSGGVEINGVSINVSYGATSSVSDIQNLVVNAINNASGQTGVRAEAFGANQFRLVAEDGRNIRVGAVTNITNAGFTATTTTYSSVSLFAGDKVELSTNTGQIGRAGFQIGTFGGGQDGQLLKNLDITTVAGANKAIQSVDNALEQISKQQADLGAIQNRFQSAISNLTINSENLSAANSRIKDADFAAETAELSRAQVLQQAGISILAQANARPQQVLSLLQ